MFKYKIHAIFFSCLLITLAAWGDQQIHVSADGQTIYYITHNAKKYNSDLFASVDGGRSFNKITTLDHTTLKSINSTDNTIFAGGSEESAKIRPNLPDSKKVTYLSKEDKEFAAADFGAIYINGKQVYMGGSDSDDDNSWLFIGTQKDNNKNTAPTWKKDYLGNCGKEGYGTQNINSISGHDDFVFAANTTFNNRSPGICISKDSGNSWQMNTQFPEMNSSAVYAAANTSTIYASGYTFNEDDNIKPELYFSNNNGNRWTKTDFGAKNNHPFITAISGNSNGSIIYLAADDYNKTSGGLWIKTNKENSFKKISLPTHHQYQFTSISTANNGKTVSAYGCYKLDDRNKICAIWSSNDSGRNWVSWS